MRIAIDARKLHDFGIGTYVRRTCCVTSRGSMRESEYVLFCRAGRSRLASSELGPNFRAGRRVRRRPTRCASRSTCRSRLLRERVDLFHSPHYVLPPLAPCPSVVTIHDCIHLMFPQYLPNRLAYVLRAHVHVAGGAPAPRGC